MADHQVSPLETASIQLGLTSLSLPANNETGPLGRPYAAEPPYNPPSPSNDAWNRVDRDTTIPVGVPPLLLASSPLPAMETPRPPQIVLLNRFAISTFMYQSEPLIREAYRRTLVPAQGARLSVNFPMVQIPHVLQPSLAVQSPPIAQHVQQASSAAGNPLPAQSTTVSQPTDMPPATVAHLVAADQPIPEVQTSAPNGLGSVPSSSAAIVASSATLPQLSVADKVTNGTSMKAQMSQNSTLSSATKMDGSPVNNTPSKPSPNTSPENSPPQKCRLPEHGGANFASVNAAASPIPNGQQNITNTTPLPPPATQPRLLVRKVELLLNSDVNGSIVHPGIESRKRKFDAQETNPQEQESSNSSSYESNSNSELNEPPPGFVRDRITGEIRQRRKMDDSDKCMRSRYRREWDELCGKDREDRGPIDGYEEGDSDLDLSDWEEAKKERRRAKKRKLF